MKPSFRLLALLVLPWFARATERWVDPHAGNPILPGYYADPSLLQVDSTAYLYATVDPWGGRTLGCWDSKDFKQWTYHTLNWPTKEACTSPTSKDAMVWAPSVVQAANGKFFMYVSVGSEIWVGTADQPLGPWRDAHGGTPLITATWNTTYHMIDAECLVDQNGSAYLYWGSGWGWKNGRCFAVKLKADMVSFDGEPRDVTPPGGHYFEGPFTVKNSSKYYLMYSDGVTIRDTYCVRYAVGDSPLGPFCEAANNPILSTDLVRDIVSPGHHAIFRRDGHTYILYHRHRLPYVPNTAFRQVCVDELTFTADGLISRVQPTHDGPRLVHDRQSGALACVATASSALDLLHTANRVLDDNYATRWAPAPDDSAVWLQLDLGSPKTIARSELRFEYAWKPYRFALETSADGQDWAIAADHRTHGISGSPIIVETPSRCRYLRLIFSGDTDATAASLFEWTVH